MATKRRNVPTLEFFVVASSRGPWLSVRLEECDRTVSKWRDALKVAGFAPGDRVKLTRVARGTHSRLAKATRAIPVVVERSPGGLNNWHVQVGEVGGLVESRGAMAPIQRAVDLMADARATLAERFRVGRLLAAELGPRGRRRAEVTAEVES